MKKIIILFCILISTNAFGDSTFGDSTFSSSVQPQQTNTEGYIYYKTENEYRAIECKLEKYYPKGRWKGGAIPKENILVYRKNATYTPPFSPAIQSGENTVLLCRANDFFQPTYKNSGLKPFFCNNSDFKDKTTFMTEPNTKIELHQTKQILDYPKVIPDPKPGLYHEYCVYVTCADGYTAVDEYKIQNGQRVMTRSGKKICEKTNKQETSYSSNTTSKQPENEIKFAACIENAKSQKIPSICKNDKDRSSKDIWFCAANDVEINNIGTFKCSGGYLTLYVPNDSEARKELFSEIFHEESQPKIDSFDPKTQTLYVGKSGLLEAANPMVANTIYNRKDGRIHIGDKNNTSSHTVSETPATEEEIAIYSKVIEELNKQIQQIEDCVNDINVTGII